VYFDFHGVSDLFAESEKLTSSKCVIISFVGKKGARREQVRKSLLDRIRSGQIFAGVLVFTRLKGEMISRCVGTKAWVISVLSKKVDKAIFLDDSSDHIELVKFSNLPYVATHLVKTREEISKLLKQN